MRARRSAAAAPGSVAPRTEEITAIPAAPAEAISDTFPGTTPPRAYTGIREARQARRSAGTPTGGPYAALDGVAYTGPDGAGCAPPPPAAPTPAPPLSDTEKNVPSSGDEAVAYSFLGIRPARNDLRPAATASRIASAMRTGFFAPAIAVFLSTPSHPSSSAPAASEADPTPASTLTGTFTVSRMIRMLYGLRIPSPAPTGAASGITAAHPAASNRFAMIGSSFV